MKISIKIRKRKINVHEFMILLILTLGHKFFYMWLQDDYMLGSLKYSDISVLLSVAYTTLILCTYGAPKQCRWKRWIYAYFGLAVVSALTAWVIYDQSLFRGICVQRCQLAYLFLFLGIERLFEIHKISKENLIRGIYFVCWLELILCTLQYIIYANGGSLFMRVKANIRYESVRLYFDPGLILVVVFRSYENLLKEKKDRIKNLIFVAWVGLFVMVITKMRMMTAAYLISLVAGLLIWRGAAIKKVLIVGLTGVIGVVGISKITIVQDLIESAMNLSQDANYGVRLSGRAIFMNEMMKSPITGRGYPSVSSEKAYGVLQRYLFVDNGIWGIIYCYGILGLVWCIGMWVSAMNKAWKLRNNNMSYLLYFIYYIVGFMTDCGWFWSATFAFAAMMALLFEEEREQIQKERLRNANT